MHTSSGPIAVESNLASARLFSEEPAIQVGASRSSEANNMWDYDEAGRVMTLKAVAAHACIYCQCALLRLPAESYEFSEKRLFVQLSFCTSCGWWTVYRVHQGEHPRRSDFESYSGTIGCLKELDVTDVSTPLSDVRNYFLARKDKMYDAHPKIIEDVVCSVFKDFGWNARVTAYSGDDGIDIILDGPNRNTIGIQVKRYKKKRRIEAEQIRSLAGAMLLGGHTKGVFITTSKFQKGAVKTAKRLAEIGWPIELIDAERFLEALGIAQIRTFRVDSETIISRIVKNCIHIGSGIAKEFTPGEDLSERPIIATVWLPEEFAEFFGKDS
jgi:restriction system protein